MIFLITCVPANHVKWCILRMHLVEFREMTSGNTLFFKVSSLLMEIDLADQRDTLSKDLSGGQKRKLSVGIALIGDPKVYTCIC